MKTEAREAVLSPADVKTILGLCSAEGVLVGGQALAFWVDHLGVRRPQELEIAVTADADFIGDSALAKKLGSARVEMVDSQPGRCHPADRQSHSHPRGWQHQADRPALGG